MSEARRRYEPCEECGFLLYRGKPAMHNCNKSLVIEAKDAEIATLRARVALLEEYAALLVESERLMLPLFVSHGCRFPEDMIKRGERLRSALMVPPIPLPEKHEEKGRKIG